MYKALIIGAGAAMLFALPALACTDISSKTVKLTGCVDAEWQAGSGEGAQEFVYLTADQNFGLQLVTETDTLAASALHDAIISNAVTAAGNKKDNVKVISEHVQNVDGKPFNVLEYTVTDGTTTIDYQNFYYSQPGFGTVQILGLSLPADATASAFKIGVFASTVKIGG